MPVQLSRDSIHTFITGVCIAAALLAGCAHRSGETSTAAASPASSSTQPLPWQNARQLILVTTADWNANQGQLHTYARGHDGHWREVGQPFAITVGRNGSAWGLGMHPDQQGVQKKEGDGRAPAGVFAIGSGFGYAPNVHSALPYRQMEQDSWCMDVPDSPLYNQIVNARSVGPQHVQGSSEPMRLDLHKNGDQRYREGFVIQHNPQAVKGAGSCIFAHLWKAPGETTAGCTAMAPESMRRLYTWLQPDQRPVFVLLPQPQYQRLRAQWQLP